MALLVIYPIKSTVVWRSPNRLGRKSSWWIGSTMPPFQDSSMTCSPSFPVSNRATFWSITHIHIYTYDLFISFFPSKFKYISHIIYLYIFVYIYISLSLIDCHSATNGMLFHCRSATASLEVAMVGGSRKTSGSKVSTCGEKSSWR